MCNFRIGQEVVAIRDHSLKFFMKGQIFTIIGLSEAKCFCGDALVNIGYRSSNTGQICNDCGHVWQNVNGDTWFSHTAFAPLQTDSEEADMNEAIAEVMERELYA